MGDAVAQHRLYQTYLGIDSCQPVAPRGEWSDDQMYADGKGPSANIYTKGSWAAHSLRYLLGEERFWDAIKLLAYDTTEPDTLRAPIPPRHRTTDDFAAIASTVAGSDLGW